MVEIIISKDFVFIHKESRKIKASKLLLCKWNCIHHLKSFNQNKDSYHHFLFFFNIYLFYWNSKNKNSLIIKTKINNSNFSNYWIVLIFQIFIPWYNILVKVNICKSYNVTEIFLENQKKIIMNLSLQGSALVVSYINPLRYIIFFVVTKTNFKFILIKCFF